MKSFRLPSLFLYITVLCTVVMVTSAVDDNSTKPPEKEHKGLKREEKAAIWAAFFGIMVGVIGFGIFVHGFFVRQFTDDYDYLNRTGNQSVHDQKTLPVEDQYPTAAERL